MPTPNEAAAALSTRDHEAVLAHRRISRGGAVLALAVVLMFRATRAGVMPIALVMAVVGAAVVLDGFMTIQYRMVPARRPPFAAPRSPRLSRGLAWFEVHSIVLEAAWIMILFQCLFGFYKARGESSPGTSTLLLFGVVAVPVSRFVLGNGTLRVVRRLVVGPLRITLLRHFDDTAAALARQYVAPMLGCYGRVVTLDDPTIRAASTMATSDAAAAMADEASWHAPSEEWKALVAWEMDHADLAAFVLSEHPSEHLAWELDEAIRRFPRERLLVFMRSDSEARQVHDSLGARLAHATVLPVRATASPGDVAAALYRRLRLLT